MRGKRQSMEDFYHAQVDTDYVAEPASYLLGLCLLSCCAIAVQEGPQNWRDHWMFWSV